MQSQKNDLDRQLGDLQDRLGELEDRNSDLQRVKKKGEQEIDNLKKNVQDMELSLRKAESEKQAREHNIRSLQDEMAQQDVTCYRMLLVIPPFWKSTFF